MIARRTVPISYIARNLHSLFLIYHLTISSF